jgi:hypothetical protein
MFLLFFLGVFIILGHLVYDDVKQFHQRAALSGNVREVVGDVTGFTFAQYSPTSIDYEFTVNGVTYSGEALESATPGRGKRFEEGDSILIRFLPSDPAINHPDAWEWSLTIGWSSALFVIFLTSIGGFEFVLLLRDRKLARVGKAAAAMVTSCTPKGRSFHVEYEFHADGTAVTGTNDGKDEYETGARVWVLYLPDKPQRNHIYPLSLYSVV